LITPDDQLDILYIINAGKARNDRGNMKDLNKMSPNEICAAMVVNQGLKLEVVENMRKYGGSFVWALAECIARADRINLFKLCEAFLDYILEYEPSKWSKK